MQIRERRSVMFKPYALALVLLMSVILIPKAIYQRATVDFIEFTVNSKERVTTDRNSKYLVFTDTETLENTDALFHLKYNSSDIYSELQIGETYKAKVYGWRIPFLSRYRNIVYIVE